MTARRREPHVGTGDKRLIRPSNAPPASPDTARTPSFHLNCLLGMTHAPPCLPSWGTTSRWAELRLLAQRPAGGLRQAYSGPEYIGQGNLLPAFRKGLTSPLGRALASASQLR